MPPLVPTAEAAAAATAAAPMQPAGLPERRVALPLRNDTILGVCEAIGEDFGFNANWLRIPLAGGVLISPLASFGIYVARGLAVLASRLLIPAPRRLAAATADARPAPHPASSQGADNQSEEERLAA